MYAQMTIGEVIAADCSAIREFQSLYKEEIEPELMRQQGCISPALFVERDRSVASSSRTGAD